MSGGTSRRRRRTLGSSDGHSGGGERWLVSYADLITLLFALFVVLYATSQADLRKLREVSESIRRAFGGAKSSVSSGLGFPGDTKGGERGAPGESVMSPSLSPQEGSGQQTDPELSQILRLLEEAAELESSVARVQRTRQGEVRWVIQDSYAEGASQVPEDFWPLLQRVARVLARFPNRGIRWEGHADSKEAFTVSVDRAVWIDHFMKKEWRAMGASRRQQPEVAALGSTRAINTDSSRWALARNRRVELIVLSQVH